VLPWKKLMIAVLLILLFLAIPSTMASLVTHAWDSVITFFASLKSANGWH